MRACFLIILIPLFVFAQSFVPDRSLPDDPFGNNRFSKHLLTMQSDKKMRTGISKPDDAGFNYALANHAAEVTSQCPAASANNPAPDDSVKKQHKILFSKEVLTQMDKSAGNLKWSANLKFGSNIISLIEVLTSFYKGETKNNDDVLYNNYKRTTFDNVLGFSNYALQIQSLNTLGRAGNFMQIASNNMPSELTYSFYSASHSLKNARTFGVISTGLDMISGTTLFYALGADADSKTFSSGLYVAGSFGLSSIIMKFFSLNSVGNAGERIEKDAEKLPLEWQKRYLSQFGRSMQRYESMWKSGFGLKVGSVGVAVISTLFDEPDVAKVGIITSGVLWFVGDLLMNWVSPYFLNSAGDSLYEMNRRFSRN